MMIEVKEKVDVDFKQVGIGLAHVTKDELNDRLSWDTEDCYTDIDNFSIEQKENILKEFFEGFIPTLMKELKIPYIEKLFLKEELKND